MSAFAGEMFGLRQQRAAGGHAAGVLDGDFRDAPGVVADAAGIADGIFRNGIDIENRRGRYIDAEPGRFFRDDAAGLISQIAGRRAGNSAEGHHGRKLGAGAVRDELAAAGFKVARDKEPDGGELL